MADAPQAPIPTSRTIKSDVVKVPPRNLTQYSKRHGIILNGVDNAYPTRMERLTYMSPTAKQAAKVMAKFIRGEGFAGGDVGMVKVGRKSGRDLTPMDLLSHAAQSISIHRGWFWHVGYNLALEVDNVTPIPFRFCRLGKPDSHNYSGKVRVYNNWDLEKGRQTRKDDIRTFDVFNPDPEVLRHQIDAAGGITNYPGQIFYFFLDDEFDYPLATIDASQNDAITEHQFGVFKRQTVLNGFLNDWVILRHAKFETDGEKQQFKQNVYNSKGADNAGNVLLVEDHFDELSPNGNLQADVVKTSLNTRLFESWEQSCSNQIRRSFNNVPEILINEVAGKLGNSSGEAIRQAREYYNTQVLEEQDAIARSFERIFARWNGDLIPNNDWTIEPLDTGLPEAAAPAQPEDN